MFIALDHQGHFINTDYVVEYRETLNKNKTCDFEIKLYEVNRLVENVTMLFESYTPQYKVIKVTASCDLMTGIDLIEG